MPPLPAAGYAEVSWMEFNGTFGTISSVGLESRVLGLGLVIQVLGKSRGHSLHQ